MLKARYRAEGNANDAGGTFNGVQNGANFSYTQGKYGQAFLFDGVDDYVSINDGDLLWPSGSFSLEAWIKTSTPPPNSTVSGTIVCKYACSDQCPQPPSANSLAYFCLYMDFNGKIGFDFRPDVPGTEDISILLSPNAIADDTWHHIVGVRDSTAQKATLYIDAAPVVTATPSAAQFGAMTNADNNVDLIGIGANEKAGLTTFESFFKGAVDEVAIYHSALTMAEVGAIYNAPEGKCP